MKKLFISADIEGTCGIAHWDETDRKHSDYPYFAKQMTAEVAAACKGARDAGYDLVVVRDAHGSARNLIPDLLPDFVQIIRGWGSHPFCMMQGLDETYQGAIMTGYHSGCGRSENPLAHTMTGELAHITINGTPANELMINSFIAAYVGTPVFAVTGDQGLLSWTKAYMPSIRAIPVNEGFGGAVASLNPRVAVEAIQDGVRAALSRPAESCLLTLPRHFAVEIEYKRAITAYKGSFYPGIQQIDACKLRYENDDYYEVLRMMHFLI